VSTCICAEDIRIRSSCGDRDGTGSALNSGGPRGATLGQTQPCGGWSNRLGSSLLYVGTNAAPAARIADRGRYGGQKGPRGFPRCWRYLKRCAANFGSDREPYEPRRGPACLLRLCVPGTYAGVEAPPERTSHDCPLRRNLSRCCAASHSGHYAGLPLSWDAKSGWSWFSRRWPP